MSSKQLLKTIDTEFAWRENEMAIAKIHLHRSILDKASFEYSCRCFIMLTYAHFEAFTKQVVAQALQDIFDSGVQWSECRRKIQINLFATRLRTMFLAYSNAEVAEKSSTSACLINKLPPPDLAVILECGNMNPTNFDWVVECIGLDPTRFSFARRDIGRLAGMRHDCAHGKALTFDTTKTEREVASDLYALQSHIVLLMHALAIDVIDHFATSGYKQAGKVDAIA
jgi:hypothetical protein